MLKKHPLCGAFLVFWGFKFLSMEFSRAIHTRLAIKFVTDFVLAS
ncbi:hypothetical protein AC05_4975 [Escherichia coli 3-267-03_S3_C1]|nr:hypothetical protein AC05_4975 [Escherichia coli 3-267-03_S3_C1]